jgi:hypothetical protein
MIPPTSIDGTDITGATIDGTDVQEITVDGDVVFSAETLPVAYSNLVAWWPFDSSKYGGSDADDVTALFNPSQSGDSTAYDGTVNGATYQSSGGLTDINAGTNSGAFDFDGSNDYITFPNIGIFSGSQDFSMCVWATAPPNRKTNFINANGEVKLFIESRNSTTVRFFVDSFVDITIPQQTNHYILAYDASGGEFDAYINGVLESTQSTSNPSSLNTINAIGAADFTSGGLGSFFDGVIDDVRIYDKKLNTTEAETIVQNTQDSNNPVFP